jgi:hypothetical protein
MRKLDSSYICDDRKRLNMLALFPRDSSLLMLSMRYKLKVLVSLPINVLD